MTRLPATTTILAAALLALPAVAVAQEARVASDPATSALHHNPVAEPVCDASGRCVGQGSLHLNGGGAPLEVASWSFGASNPSSVSSSSSGAGRVVSPRDTASGLPTGKRQHRPISVSSSSSSSSSSASSSGSGGGAGKASMSDLSVMRSSAPPRPLPVGVPPMGVITAKVGKGGGSGPRCTMGTHFPTAQLRSGSSIYLLSDVTVSACDSSDAGDSVSLSYQKIEMR